MTGTVHGTPEDFQAASPLLSSLAQRVGRLVFNGFPTGVDVSAGMTHGGPFPATTDARFTSVGTQAMYRFLRPLTYQNAPAEVLPAELHPSNPQALRRSVDGAPTDAPC